MPQNDIKPFATGVGANVVSQAAYEALTTLLANGFQAGIAKSDELNKVWRQSSFIASSYAQFIVDQLGVDVLDDGDVEALTTKFVNALTALIQSASPKTMLYCGTSTGAANAQVLTPSPAITAYGVGVPGYIFVAGYTNTTSLFVNISGVGAVEVRKDGPTGLVPLTGGEVHVGSMCLLRYDGTYMRLEDSQLGTAALMNASSGAPGGTVASVSGAVTAGHMAVFADTNGTVQDGGAAPTVGAAGALGIGQGLENDGAGNLQVKLNGTSVSRSSSGLSLNLSSANVWVATQSGTVAVLTDAATIAWDLSVGQVSQVTLSGNRTLGAPTNQVAGTYYSLRVVQDGTGNRTLAYNAAYKGVTGITLSTTAGAVDHLVFRSTGTVMELVQIRRNIGD